MLFLLTLPALNFRFLAVISKLSKILFLYLFSYPFFEAGCKSILLFVFYLIYFFSPYSLFSKKEPVCFSECKGMELNAFKQIYFNIFIYSFNPSHCCENLKFCTIYIEKEKNFCFFLKADGKDKGYYFPTQMF